MAIYRRKMAAEDELYVLITSDHGMTQIRTLINFRKLFATPLAPTVRMVMGHVTAQIFLDDVGEADRESTAAGILKTLGQYDFIRTYRRADLPQDWHMAHPRRTGDIVAMLKPGYAFKGNLVPTSAPADKSLGIFGIHGYPPDECPDMAGLAIIWRHSRPLGGKDLGRIEAIQLHATVAKWLGIAPAKTARGKVIDGPWRSGQ